MKSTHHVGLAVLFKTCLAGLFWPLLTQQPDSAIGRVPQANNEAIVGSKFDENTKDLPPLPIAVDLTMAKSGPSRYRILVTLTNLGESVVQLPFETMPEVNAPGNAAYRRTRKTYGVVSVVIRDSQGKYLESLGTGHYGDHRAPSTLLNLAPGEKLFVDFYQGRTSTPKMLEPGKYTVESDYFESSYDLPDILHVAGVAKSQKVSPPVNLTIKEKTILE